MLKLRRHLVRGVVVTTVVASLYGRGALGAEELAQTVGGWLVACHQTEAGGRECEVRNDEDGKPALGQDALLAFTLHDGRNDAEGLLRIADLDLPPRLKVVISFGDETMILDGVGRRGRLAARFALPRQELANLATADAIEVRFEDKGGREHAVSFVSDGLDEALTRAEEHLAR
jgi:invasion protein IalB